METKEVIKSLIANGAKKVENLQVRNVTVTPQENYVRVALTLDKEVDGYRDKGDGTYEEAKTNVIFVSLYSLTSMLKENDDAAFAANHIAKHPDAISLVMSRAKIAILQESVVSGQEYRNPWSSNSNAEATVFDHDTIINHVVDIEISQFGLKALDRLMDKMLG